MKAIQLATYCLLINIATIAVAEPTTHTGGEEEQHKTTATATDNQVGRYQLIPFDDAYQLRSGYHVIDTVTGRVWTRYLDTTPDGSGIESSSEPSISGDDTTERRPTTEELFVEVLGPNPDIPVPLDTHVRYNLNVSNRGQQTLREVKLTTKTTEGIRLQNEQTNHPRRIGKLKPGESEKIELKFKVHEVGRQKTTFIVSAANARDVRVTAAVIGQAIDAQASHSVKRPPKSRRSR